MAVRMNVACGVLLLLMCIAAPASACECADGFLDTKTARAAKHVVVFRVMATAVVPSEIASARAVAKIKIIDRLRGTARFDTVTYSTSWCCGVRIEAGTEYMVFTNALGPKVEVNLGNLLVPSAPFEYKRDSPFYRHVLDVLGGKRTLGKALVQASFDRMAQFPAPPPPPCPESKTKLRL